MPSRTSRRGLSTARAALQVAWLLVARPQGIRADDVAEQLGKSVSTAYNLLVSLCDEGVAVHHSGGLYRLSPAFAEMVTSATAAPADELHDLSGVVAELLARTHKRSYLGILRAGELHVVAERGAQGMAKLPGLGAHIADTAHALGLGKVMLAIPLERAWSGLAWAPNGRRCARSAAAATPSIARSSTRTSAASPPPSSTPGGGSSRRSGSR